MAARRQRMDVVQVLDRPVAATAAKSGAPEISSGTQTAQSFEPPPAIGQSFQQSLDMFREAVSDLEAAQTDPAQQSPPNHEGELIPPARSTAAATAAPRKDYENPTTAVVPTDPPGWDRIYEGSFLEAVLVTQLSGDFPGPVLATVSVPFYSSDRQRILIPRGTRAIGTAQAVEYRDQSRLAIGFHRLLFPDGRWVALDFHGLNQVGEGALKALGGPALLLHVCGRRSSRGDLGPDLARQRSICRRLGRFPGRSRARTGSERHPDLAALSESFPHYHDSGRSPAAHLVHFRRNGSPARGPDF